MAPAQGFTLQHDCVKRLDGVDSDRRFIAVEVPVFVQMGLDPQKGGKAKDCCRSVTDAFERMKHRNILNASSNSAGIFAASDRHDS
jgi:hypothetical protein